MPIYRFAVRREGDHDSDVRWTHLPDKETARRFANLLIKEFVSSGRYSDSTRTCLEVKDDSGALLLSIPFRISPKRNETRSDAKRAAGVAVDCR
jgi:hypothetical protein